MPKISSGYRVLQLPQGLFLPYTSIMKISLNWLQDFITLTIKDPQEISKRVTAGVAEVDEVEILGGLLDHCCVGKILTLKKHPNADRLSLCDVQTDDGIKKIVCGGTNLRIGMRVALAHVGARVRWHGTEMMTLEKTGIRGEMSEGMICTAAELDIQSRFPQKDEHHVVDLGPSSGSGGDDGVGESLKDYLGLDDVVLHIDNHAITHRADLFSHVGFAREFVALGLARWIEVARGNRGKKGNTGKRGLAFPKTALPMKCIVDRKDLVPRYSSCLIEIDGIGETPKWMRTRLEATGWRCVSLPVDITNYVAMETGMPLHSFDADDIRGDFHIDTAKKGETITTLDEVKRVLPEGAIILRDNEGIFDLLGIMGGLRSSTKESTKKIYLHAAIADPASIRKAIIATGHRTDASTVYEKGIPRESATRGLLRAVELFLELVPGARLASKLEEWGDEGKATSIDLSLDRVNSMLGVEISEKKIVKILEDLEFTVEKGKRKVSGDTAVSADRLIVTPPLHRLGDIRGQHDLIEEIGRIAGYNEIPTAMPKAAIDPPKRDMRMHRFRDILKEDRFVEIVPISLTGEAQLRKAGLDPSVAVEVRNPISDELKLLHTSTLPGLLEHAQRNILLSSDRLRTFHLARVFQTGQPEHAELGVLLANIAPAEGPHALLEEPYLLLKRTIRQALCGLGYKGEVAVAGVVAPYAHPGRYAELLIRPSIIKSSRDASEPFTRIGTLFELHPSITASYDLPHRAAAALIDVSALLAIAPAVTIAQAVPQFPAVTYDQTESVRHTQSVGDVLKRLRGSHDYLESVFVKDLYVANKDSYNLTLTFTYRAKDRTLTEEEAKKVHEKVLAQMG